MQTPPLPSGEPSRPADSATPTEPPSGASPPGEADGPSTVLRPPAPRTDAANGASADDDVLADLFLGDDAQVSDESPTVITKHPAKPPEDIAADSLRGRRLAHFELLEPIGVGGMAA